MPAKKKLLARTSQPASQPARQPSEPVGDYSGCILVHSAFIFAVFGSKLHAFFAHPAFVLNGFLCFLLYQPRKQHVRLNFSPAALRAAGGKLTRTCCLCLVLTAKMQRKRSQDGSICSQNGPTIGSEGCLVGWLSGQLAGWLAGWHWPVILFFFCWHACCSWCCTVPAKPTNQPG